MPIKPFSQACENNKGPILEIIRAVFDKPVIVWEIGSGTGQHACFFAGEMPRSIWQPTDLPENHPGINAWRDDAHLANLNPPLALDVTDEIWPCTEIDALFTANTLHIMSWRQIVVMFDRLRTYLSPSATVCIYGPFNYNGRYTNESNGRFDAWLKNRDPLSGIRDFEAVVELAVRVGLHLSADHAMPANNRLLVFQKRV